MAEDTPPPSGEGGGKKKGSFFQRYKIPIIAGGGAFAVLALFLLLKGGSGTAATADTTAANGGIDPDTGYLYGSPADLAAQGSSGATSDLPGPAGPAGPTGPAGPAGPTGGTAPPVATNPPAAGGSSGTVKYKTLTVTSGQTLSGIAAKYKESLATLLKDNPTYTTNKKYDNGNKIWAGDKVKVRT